MEFAPDPEQERVLGHAGGALLVTGPAGTGKTAVLRERFARLIQGGADPERVALVVGSPWARSQARSWLLKRLTASLADLRVITVHGLAFHVVSKHHQALGYEAPPDILSAADQFAKVQELLRGEDPADWPAYGSMLGLRGFADEVRQFLSRAQEALLTPEDIAARAQSAGLAGWAELASFYRRYLEVLDGEGVVDFAGLVEQAAAVAREGPAPFDHLVVDDYQDATFAAEALVIGMGAESLVVAGDPDAHVFSFRGTSDRPIRQFTKQARGAEHVSLAVRHRGLEVATEAWLSPHTSEEYAAVARELSRVHVEEDVPWSAMAVVVRRQGSHVGGLLRALDDRGVPRWMPEQELSVVAEPATYPFVLALRWLAHPNEREALVEPVLASELARIAPAAARGLVRSARAAGQPAEGALEHAEGLSAAERDRVVALRAALEEAERVAGRSVLDAFSVLWRRLPYAARLVDAAEHSPEARRDLDAIVAFSQAVARAGESADPSVQAFVARLQAGEEGPGQRGPDAREPEAVLVLTAHGSVGRELDTVVVVGAVEGNFPSLSRPEPMFDLAVLEGRVSQSGRNRLRLEDERRLFRMVLGRAARRVLLTASDTHDDPGLSARSRFAEEAGVKWTAAPAGPFAEPVTAGEAAVTWRRTLADRSAAEADRLAALDGLVALGVEPSRWWFQRSWTDTGRPLHERIRVSFSRLDRLENCELQYVLSEELGLGTPAGYHAWVGQLVHKLIEDYEAGKVSGGLEGLVAEAETRWKQAEFPSFAVSEAFRRLVVGTMLANWFREYGDKPALAREQRFEYEYAGATVTGYIDRIGEVTSGGTKITDYKTGKADKAGKADENLQLGIYYLAIGQVPDLEPFRPVRGVELAFLRGKWNDPSHVARAAWQWNGKSEPGYRQAMEERLTGLIDRIGSLNETEVYRPNPAADCFFCEFRSLCPLWPEGAPLFPEGATRR